MRSGNIEIVDHFFTAEPIKRLKKGDAQWP